MFELVHNWHLKDWSQFVLHRAFFQDIAIFNQNCLDGRILNSTLHLFDDYLVIRLPINLEINVVYSCLMFDIIKRLTYEIWDNGQLLGALGLIDCVSNRHSNLSPSSSLNTSDLRICSLLQTLVQRRWLFEQALILGCPICTDFSLSNLRTKNILEITFLH